MQSGYDEIGDIIEHAFNGQQAVELIQNAFFNHAYTFGLIFMDCSMPIMDGYQTTDWIRNFSVQEGLQ